MKNLDINIGLPSKEERTYTHEAIRAGWLNDLDQQVIHGDYATIDLQCSKEFRQEKRLEASAIAERKVVGYLISKDPNNVIACAVARLLGCTKYDVVEIVVDGSKFEAVNALSNQKVKGEFRILNSVVRFVFNYEDGETLDNMRHSYIATQNKALRDDGYDSRWYLNLSDLSNDEHISKLMEQWVELNPMPEFTDHEDFNHAVAKAYWSLRKDEAATVLSGGEYPLYTPAYRWNIEQAIINRNPEKTMLQASIEYVENLTSNLALIC